MRSTSWTGHRCWWILTNSKNFEFVSRASWRSCRGSFSLNAHFYREFISLLIFFLFFAFVSDIRWLTCVFRCATEINSSRDVLQRKSVGDEPNTHFDTFLFPSNILIIIILFLVTRNQRQKSQRIFVAIKMMIEQDIVERYFFHSVPVLWFQSQAM